MLDSRTLLKDSFANPYFKQLNITEWDNNWILIRDHYYLVKLFLFDRDKNPIQLTVNLVFKNIFDPEFFDVIKINKISSEVIVRAKQVTPKNHKTLLTSILEEIKSESPYLTYYVE